MNGKRTMNTKRIAAVLACTWLAGLPSLAHAQLIIQDTFTGASSTYNWKPLLGACLTAGDGTGTIPKCLGLPYYGVESLIGGQTGVLPDTTGNGALRFTNGSPGGYNQAGGVISNFTYPSSNGLQVTFTTMTYRGDSGGGIGNGADGISFFLMDGNDEPASIHDDVGAFGGSLGYTCSNVNDDTNPTHLRADLTTRHYDGLAGGYIGLGIDEYGNFLNGVLNYSDGTSNNGADNTATGYGYQGGRIGLRGAGSVSWRKLNARYPLWYPSTLDPTLQPLAVQKTCQTGQLWNYSAVTLLNRNPTGPMAAPASTPFYDYPAIPGAVAPASGTLPFSIANEGATNRTQAQPITYNLKITSSGLLTFKYSYNNGAYQTVINSQSITASNGPLPANFRFGFAGSTGGSTNIHEVLCFNAAPGDSAATSAGLNEKQTAKVQTGSQVYFAFYNPADWSGSLTAQNLVVDAVTGFVTISPTSVWDASCVLTGVVANQKCVATGVSGPTAAQGPGSRSILSYNGTTGIPFQYASLSGSWPAPTSQKTAIDLGDATPNTAKRVNYLRGDRSNEQNALGVGLYNQRDSVLGDIVDSSPTWVGPPSGPYKAVFTDRLAGMPTPPENSATTSYPTFKANLATRLNVVYSGANDGLLHGFRAGSYAADGVTYVADAAHPNDGYEVLAYMPAAVVNAIHSNTTPAIDFSNPNYGHAFFVDAPPGEGDLYYGGTWHSWVIGGLGPGGAAIYALDVTDPTTFSEGNAASLVIGEWNNTSATSTGGISCSNVANCYKNLGNTYGVPQIRRFHNGMWGAVFGNGFGSASGDAGIYVMTVDTASHAVTFYYLSAGVNGGNGIAYASPADLDGDHIIDYVYAGDLKGNVWRFDLTSSTPGSWAVSPGGPLFTTPGAQPITTKLAVAATPSASGPQRIMVDFGTGRQIPLTNASPTTYASGTQSLYGIWDWNMSNWNLKGSTQFASLGASNTFGTYAITTGKLQQQTLTDLATSTGTSSGFRSASNLPVCWQGSATCGSGNTQFGWYINLPDSSEQVIFNPVLQVGAFIVNTTIPAASSLYNCQPANATGWTVSISPSTGASFTKSFFGDASGHFVNYNNQIVSGVALSGTGSVSIVTTSGTTTGTFLVTQTTSGVGTVLPINPLATAKGTRLTWIERR